ncbi:hypothetical protein QWY14_11465 [Planococcus sp. N028]|uniref:Uncharacterized protein n=1 Tax=Planococcus shixiaomingii TaxID=3058393 RepID=A0ABT8N460_9BACL|nr:hypothetical protein [Planococcus sp. N028]
MMALSVKKLRDPEITSCKMDLNKAELSIILARLQSQRVNKNLAMSSVLKSEYVNGN